MNLHYFRGCMRRFASSIISIPAILAWAISGIILLPPLFGRGGFVDSLLYASIARNLSLQEWHSTGLYFSDTFYRDFAEHPPLMFWMGSWWFRWMGDHAWTEKGFSLLIAIATFFAFYRFWKRHIPGHVNRYGWGWWMLFWCLIPGPLWGLGQFMLENPLTLFTFLAVWSSMSFNRVLACVGLGLCTWLAVLTKGPPGLFPMAAPMLLWISRLQSTRNMIKNFVCSWVVFGFLSALGWAWTPLRQAMTAYWQRQVEAVFTGARPAYEVGSERTRIGMVWTFLQEMLVPLALLLICYWVYRWLKYRNLLKSDEPSDDPLLKQLGLFFMLVALSATVPLFVSPKLHPHYLIPAYPWWSLGLTCFSIPVLRRLPYETYELRHSTHHIIASAALLSSLSWCIGYSWTKHDAPVRDFELQSDIEQLATLLRRKSATGQCQGIAISPELHGQYAIWLYMQRYYRLSLIPNPSDHCCLVLKAKDSPGLNGHRQLSDGFTSFDVYSSYSEDDEKSTQNN